MKLKVNNEYFLPNLPVLKGVEEIELARKIKENNCKKSRDKLVLSNLKLVVKIAKKYLNNNVPQEDLIQEGNLGLLKAVEKYDPELGYRFSTYATWWIDRNIQRYLTDKSRMIRLSSHTVEFQNKILSFQKKLHLQGKEGTPEEISELSGFSVEKIKKTINITGDTNSLDEFINGSSDEKTIDYFLADLKMSVCKDVQKKVDQEIFLQKISEILTEKELACIKLKFGIESGTPLTIKEINQAINISSAKYKIDSSLKKLKRYLQLVS